jgi:hypothetical protein
MTLLSGGSGGGGKFRQAPSDWTEYTGGVASIADPGKGCIKDKHSTDVESPPPPAPSRVCMSIHPEGQTCSDLVSSACSD